MKPTLVLTLLEFLALSTPALADFQLLTGTAGGTPNTGVVADEPHVQPGDREAPRAPLRPRVQLVTGFGDNVPLAFACRQIVPKGLSVAYGPGADPDMVV